MGLLSFSRGTGRDALARWMAVRARDAEDTFAVEEALLAGRFARYAARRLAAFGAARVLAIILHVVELTWLAEIFTARPFVASLALQNVTLVLDAAWFGALEAQRRRARELGQGTASTALAQRWLTIACWVAIVVVAVTALRMIEHWHKPGAPPPLLHLYALACAVRLAADLVIRTYYSGVFAFHRVYRPPWLPLVTPFVLVFGTLALWRWLAGYAFVASLFLSVVASRAPLFFYTRRAYRMRRIPVPRFMLIPRTKLPTAAHVRDAVLGGLANTTTRLGAVVLVAAVVPSLAKSDAFGEATGLEPFAFALHLAAPLLFLASQWWLVFYHDWKRLDSEAAGLLARVLHVRILVVSVAIGIVAWLGAAALVLVYVPFEQTWRTLLALGPATIGLSVWTALQLRGFARGEFVRQVASSAAMIFVLVTVLSAEWLGHDTWFIALGSAPWAAIATWAALAWVRTAHRTGEVETIAQWTAALRAARHPVAVWLAKVKKRPAPIAARIANALGTRGAVVRSGDRILWFEREPTRARHAWLAHGTGMIARLARRAPASGREQESALEAAGLLTKPARAELLALERAHAEHFPEGFVVHVGRAPPAPFLALPASTRQAIWRDAVRARRGVRGRSGWFVTAYAPQGAAEILYVTRRPVPSGPAAAWHAVLQKHAFRILVNDA